MLVIFGLVILGALVLVMTGALASVAIAPGRTRLGPEVPAAGLVVLILASYVPYQFAHAAIAAPIVVFVVVAIGAVAVVRWLRLDPTTRSIPRPSRGLLATLTLGSAASLILLVPILEAGFPTTVSWSNWDAWAYSGVIDWLQAGGVSGTMPDARDPISFPVWSSDSLGFPSGIESVLASLAFVTQRLGFEVAGPSLALGGLVATSGWMTLVGGAGLRRPGWMAAVAAAVAGLSPMLLVTSVQVYANQFVSLCLWPFAIGLTLFALAKPTVAKCIAAGAGIAAVMSVYPTMLIWTLPAILGVAIGVLWSSGWIRSSAKSVALALVGVGLVAILAAPLQLATAIHNLLFVSGKTGNPGFADLSGQTLTKIGLGTWFPIGNTVGWTSTVLTIIIIVSIGLAAASITSRATRSSWIPVVIGVALPGAFIAAIYASTDPYPYGAYKAVTTGGALVMGTVVMCLVACSQRRPALAGVGVALIAMAWVPQVSGLLESASSQDATGFRATDVRTIRALGTLPNGATTLVEGAADSPRAFRARMMLAYGASSSATGPVVGLGTTGSYLTGGGGDEWIPIQPWDFVATYEDVPFLARSEPPVWADGPYAIRRAPALDVTPWGSGWYPTEQFNGTPYAWLSKPGSLLISNRSSRQRRIQLSMSMTSAGLPRVATLEGGGASARVAVPKGRPTAMTLTPTLAARSVTRVRVGASPATPVQVSPADPRALMMMVSDVQVSAAP